MSDRLTFGDRAADWVSDNSGSWRFIGLCIGTLLVWMIGNLTDWWHFDPYPFILLNLVLSCIADLQAPVIMMSNRRQDAKFQAFIRQAFADLLDAVKALLQSGARDTTLDEDTNRIIREMAEQHASQTKMIADQAKTIAAIAAKVGVDG
ncbi:MAG: DUF1003 domain-containing protein [Betaproteobacteria bacterium]|nr:DUF1003 domain-containing protein [Betaproteobacteria bacterium]